MQGEGKKRSIPFMQEMSRRLVCKIALNFFFFDLEKYYWLKLTLNLNKKRKIEMGFHISSTQTKMIWSNSIWLQSIFPVFSMSWFWWRLHIFSAFVSEHFLHDSSNRANDARQINLISHQHQSRNKIESNESRWYASVERREDIKRYHTNLWQQISYSCRTSL